MKILTTISRILVGALFIVSGLIKANDSLGFSYKLVEYFEPAVLNLEFLIPLALPIAIIISVVEIILGFMVLFGAKMKFGAWVLLLMIVFFSFLTFYSAYFNKVTDCGCFGDALKITPWQSFTKDIVLLIFTLIIFIRRKHIELNNIRQNQVILPIATLLISLFAILMLGWPFAIFFFIVIVANIILANKFLGDGKQEWATIGSSTLFSLFVVVYTLMYLPIKDFRPYAVGKSVSEGMKSAEELGLESPKYATDFKLKNKSTGEEKIFSSAQYSEEKLYETWEFIESQGEPYKVSDGYEPPIHDFVLQNNADEDITYKFLQEPKALALICYDLEKANAEAIKAFESVHQELLKKGVQSYIFTASVPEEIESMKTKTNTSIPFISADAITLKTIVRSSPGFVLFNQGVIKAKWSYRIEKSAEEINALL